MHETQFLEVPTDEAVWVRYAAAALASGTRNPHAAAYAADEMLVLHRKRWPNTYEEHDGDAECNARAAALIPQMVTLIRTLSRASEDNFQWMVDEAKRLAAELD